MLPCLRACAALFAEQTGAVATANPAYSLLESLSMVVGAAGAGVIVWGAYCSVVRLIAAETALARGQTPRSETSGRPVFATYVLLGLEFLIAANIIKTLVTPDWQHVAMLAGIVVIRAVISLNLRWEASRAFGAREPAPVERLIAPPESTPAAPAVESAVVSATVSQ